MHYTMVWALLPGNFSPAPTSLGLLPRLAQPYVLTSFSSRFLARTSLPYFCLFSNSDFHTFDALLSVPRTKHHERGNQKEFRPGGTTTTFKTLFSSFRRKRREEQTNKSRPTWWRSCRTIVPQRKTYSRAVLINSTLYKALMGKVNCAHLWI